jgi:maltose O-acetyltransferase
VSDQRDRMLRGELYLAGDPDIRADHERCGRLLERFNAAGVSHVDARRAILAELLGDLGNDVVVRPPLVMDLGYQTSVGAGTFINAGCVILDVGRVTIGERCQIGPNVQILTPTHPLDPEMRRTGVEAAEPIEIADDVWLGGGVIVCPGVTIGRDTVVGAGAVVTKDLPPRVLAVGNPARVVRQL